MAMRVIVTVICVALGSVACEAVDDSDGSDILVLAGDGAVSGEQTMDGGVPADSDAETDPNALTAASSCAQIAANWPAEWVRFEDQVLEITNEYRAQGYDCRSGGQFPAALPLRVNEDLRCAARRHNIDMVHRNFFDHVNPDQEGPDVRVGRTPYPARAIGENIAAGQARPDGVVRGWMDSDGHCANIMNRVFEELGVGYIKSQQTQFKHFWTQVFGSQ